MKTITIDKKLYEEMVKMIKEFSESSSTEYGQGDDDPGACIHCYQVSYKEHKPDCLIVRAKNLSDKLKD